MGFAPLVFKAPIPRWNRCLARRFGILKRRINHCIEGAFNAPMFRGLYSQHVSHRSEKMHRRIGRLALVLGEREQKSTPFDERVLVSRSRSTVSDGAERSCIEPHHSPPNETRETNKTIYSKEEILFHVILKITIASRGYMRAQLEHFDNI